MRCFALACLYSSGVRASEVDPPNFLIFLSDDCTYHDFGCYGNGDVETPHIDGLAREGLLFEHSYNSSPMCAPTRMSLYTGIHPVRNGAHPNHSRVYDHVRSFPHYLEPLGYKVALIGKTHHSPKENFPFEFLGGRHHDNGQGEDLELSKVDAFIQENGKSPWCLMVNSNQPHTPWNRGDPSQYDAGELTLPPYLVDTKRTRDELAKYYAEITYMDEQLGRCLEFIEKRGQSENTVVVFLSEQGSNFPHCKWTCYDTGLRSAQIIRWPKRVLPGARTRAMVQYVDLLPTCIELAGGDPGAFDLDGKSFVPVLENPDAEHRTQVYGVQTSKGIYHGPDAFGIRTVRDSRFRLIWNVNSPNEFRNSVVENSKIYASWRAKGETGDAFALNQYHRYQVRNEFELYDLSNDPFELRDLSANPDYEKTLETLHSLLLAWMREQGDDGAATELDAWARIDAARRSR